LFGTGSKWISEIQRKADKSNRKSARIRSKPWVY